MADTNILGDLFLKLGYTRPSCRRPAAEPLERGHPPEGTQKIPQSGPIFEEFALPPASWRSQKGDSLVEHAWEGIIDSIYAEVGGIENQIGIRGPNKLNVFVGIHFILLQ
jgi:hypothetical protein